MPPLESVRSEDMKSEKVSQMSESYFVGLVLAVVGGYIDAYTYLARGEVFANAQTGNLVLLGINFVSGNFMKAVSYLPPILAFIVGVVITEEVRKLVNKGRLHWRQYIIILEIIVIAVVCFLPEGKADWIDFNMVTNVMISFVCSLQVQCFRNIRGISCATTMCTGNLRSGTECLAAYAATKDKIKLHSAGKFYGLVLFFVIGAAVSAYITNIIHEKSVIFSAIGLVTVLIAMFIRLENETEIQ